MEVYRYRTMEPEYLEVLGVDLAEYTYRVIVPGAGMLAYGDEVDFVILLDDPESVRAAEDLLDQITTFERFAPDDRAIGFVVDTARKLNVAVKRLERLGLAEDFDPNEVLAAEKSAARDALLLLQQILSGPPVPRDELHPCPGELMLLARSNQDEASFSVLPEPTLELSWCWECGVVLYSYDPADGTPAVEGRYRGKLDREELALRIRNLEVAQAFKFVQTF